jgi:hypothetical protein
MSYTKRLWLTFWPAALAVGALAALLVLDSNHEKQKILAAVVGSLVGSSTAARSTRSSILPVVRPPYGSVRPAGLEPPSLQLADVVFGIESAPACHPIAQSAASLRASPFIR